MDRKRSVSTNILRALLRHSYILLVLPLLVIVLFSYDIVNPGSEKEYDPKTTYVVGFYISGEGFSNEIIDEDISDTMGLHSDDMKFYYLVDYNGFGNTEFFTIKNHSRFQINISTIMPYDSSELNLGSKETLSGFARFIHNMESTYKVLVLWGHGKGNQGICFDGDQSLSGEDISSSIEPSSVDLLIMDACEMNCYQFLDRIIGVTDLVLGSEKDVPDRGFDYAGGFSEFRKQSNKTPEVLAKMIIQNTISFYQRTPSKYSVQLSLIDMDHFKDFTLIFDEMEIDQKDYPTYESGKMTDMSNIISCLEEKEIQNAYYDSIIFNDYLKSPSGVKVENSTGISYNIYN